MSSDQIKVAVRVRPINRRELEMGTQSIIEMKNEQTILHRYPIGGDEKKNSKSFAFDYCFNSMYPTDETFATQETVFESVGKDILENAFQGYNACIFAYGQTGSGKSYTMMGTMDDKGVIPRLCDSLFDMISKKQNSELTFKVEVSYMEIYNEKVRDLLDPNPNKPTLKVREHVVLGPYVDGLSQLAVTCYEDIDKLMTEGNKSRTVAATNMNSESSRSHAVFSVTLTQILTDMKSGVCGEKVSRMSLVDLAGSERAVKTCAIGDRLKEGSNINKSLTTLGLVISKLADQGNLIKNKFFVPYRDSVLTWLLKDNLGGNSRTVMIATISPSLDNYEETLSTLRYADRAKRIVNHAVVNEDPNARIIRELRQEVEALKEMLLHATNSSSHEKNLHEKLNESEKLMKEMSQTWEEKLIKTERLQQERQEILGNMGISVQSSGIMVEKSKYYLVNLNADPSLNEMLVYYLKEVTVVGSENADIILSGLGIETEHCVMSIEDDALYMNPVSGARCYVNGAFINQKTLVRHGDRILWGNHHFFRVNCPKTSEPPTPVQPLDYNFARQEFILRELINDPIQTAISTMEKKHEEDKQVALEKQRQGYERQFQLLKNIMSPSPSTPYAPSFQCEPVKSYAKVPSSAPVTQIRVEKWAKDREATFHKSINRLKIDLVLANTMVQEANHLAEEMDKCTKYRVTLQIPPANLTPNKKRGIFVEPAILVDRKGHGSQVWSMDKLENKLIDMREAFDEFKRGVDISPIGEDNILMRSGVDPFYENRSKHYLIGVANIFLNVLFYDVVLEYQAPIINQQGEVTGRLQIEIGRISGSFPQDRMSDSFENEGNTNATFEVTIQFKIKEATGLPLLLEKMMFCQYSFWGLEDNIVVPSSNSDEELKNDSPAISFNHTKTFVVQANEEFIEFCSDGALSIEVWGHRSDSCKTEFSWVLEETQLAKARSLADRWNEVTRRLELWVEIQEINDDGEYSPVDVNTSAQNNVSSGGIYQLRQGQQRRICVSVKPLPNSGTLPITCDSITNVAIGGILLRNHLQKPLDSYQEEDLNVLRDRWSDALMRRRNYLDNHIQGLLNKKDKGERDLEREQSLMQQWVSLTEERNAVLVPSMNSGIPGAPSDWVPSTGMESHIPVLFLDLNGEDLLSGKFEDECDIIAGANSILPKEHGKDFYNLPIIKYCENEAGVITAWDSSIHDCSHLNVVTNGNDRIYMILKATVELSHPIPMSVVLRKRLCVQIYKRQSLTGRLFKRIVRPSTVTKTGITYEIVSNIPKASEELEERESLAQIAASIEHTNASFGGESYIEKYIKNVSAVESILKLDKLRQHITVKEGLLNSAKGCAYEAEAYTDILTTAFNLSLMRKTASSFDIREDLGKSFNDDLFTLDVANDEPLKAAITDKGDEGIKKDAIENVASSAIARPTYLNLNVNLNQLRYHHGIKCASNAQVGLRMETLHEERPHAPGMGWSDDATNIAHDCEDNAGSPRETLATPFASDLIQTPSTSSSGYISEGFPNFKSNNEGSSDSGSPINDFVEIAEDYPDQSKKNDATSGKCLNQEDRPDEILPEWIAIGENIQIRPYNWSGVIAYVGRTNFACGTWIGVELNVPMGKNDGTVQGVKYFQCKPKHGIFVRSDKIVQDHIMKTSVSHDKKSPGDESFSKSRVKSKSTSRLAK